MRATTSVKQAAPGRLELVRALLNSWEIPKATRVPTDHLPRLLEDPRAWDKRFPGIPVPPPDTTTPRRLREFRDGLRTMVRAGKVDGPWVNRQLEAVGLLARVNPEGESPRVVHAPPPRADPRAPFLAAVIDSIADGTWLRLKECPDCRWISYDWTRNGTKVWCRPYAGSPERRACGSIAKVRRYRERQRGR
jgi:predicted RNA-binding Zn ribbon-like protein